MRIGSHFQTDIDTALYDQLATQYGPENVLLIKKHPLYLTKTFRRHMLALVALGGSLASVFASGDTIYAIDYIMSAILIISYGYLLCFVSLPYYRYSIKTNVHSSISKKNYDQEVVQQQAVRFEKLIKHNFVMIVLYSLELLSLFVVSLWLHEIPLWLLIIQACCLIVALGASYKIIFIHIRFELQFLLVTPQYIDYISQKSLFSRIQKTIKSDQIKSIELEQQGFIYSFLKLGKMSFLTDAADGTKQKNFGFNYLGNPEETKRMILQIMQ